MWHKLKAWVLTRYAYGDKGAVVHCYTDEFGQQAYFLHNIRSKTSPIRASMLLPFTPLQLVATHSQGDTLNRVREASIIKPYYHLHTQPDLQAFSLYMAELMRFLFQTTEVYPGLWTFVENCMDTAESQKQLNPHLSLWMTLHFLSISGYAIGEAPETDSGWLIQEGCWIRPATNDSIAGDELKLMGLLQSTPLHETELLLSSAKVRRGLLDKLVLYLRYHHPGMPALKSLDVLRSLFV